MTLTPTLPIDDQIRRSAMERLGCADASVFEYTLSDRAARGSDDAGAWFCLLTKANTDDAWQMTARRRTKAELLQLGAIAPSP